MKDTFVSWYFDLSSHSILYGATVWKGSVDNKRVDLVDSQTGFTNTLEIIDLISRYSKQHIGIDDDLVLFDNTPEMKTISQVLKRPFYSRRTERIPGRTGQISEQILQYGVMLNHEFFYVPDSVLIQPDLIFDMAFANLIDPIYSDEQVSFPLTESLLIACHNFTELEKRSLAWLKD